MSTPSQAAANAANAALSTGPRSEAGKQASSRNALRHGLTSKTLVLKTEDQAAFDELRATLHATYSPLNDLEHAAVEALAEAHWRLNRCRRYETCVFDQAVADIQRDNPELDPDEAAARLFLDPAHMKKMSLFLRYQTSIERALAKAMAELTRLQKQRVAAALESVGFVSQPGFELPFSPSATAPHRPPVVPEKTAALSERGSAR